MYLNLLVYLFAIVLFLTIFTIGSMGMLLLLFITFILPAYALSETGVFKHIFVTIIIALILMYIEVRYMIPSNVNYGVLYVLKIYTIYMLITSYILRAIRGLVYIVRYIFGLIRKLFK